MGRGVKKGRILGKGTRRRAESARRVGGTSIGADGERAERRKYTNDPENLREGDE